MRILFLTVFMLFTSSAFAEFYKYTDESGAVRFTDNLADVPEEQRQKIPGYKESQTPETADTDAGNNETADNAAELSVEKIRALKEELDKERTQLTEERNAIREARKKEGITKDEQIELNEKTEALNLRITEFEKKQEEYRNRVAEFNRQIDELNFRKKKEE